MPTDLVQALLAEVRAKAEGMPEGPYVHGFSIIDDWGTEVWYPFLPGEEFPRRTHAAYFAALDPALVLALVRLAEAILRYPQGTSWADYDELVAAEDALRALAAARLGGGE